MYARENLSGGSRDATCLSRSECAARLEKIISWDWQVTGLRQMPTVHVGIAGVYFHISMKSDTMIHIWHTAL